ncbi:MAG TPA: cysteine rich repeat-containing protein [Pseudolabrys sp.]|nr:cysteine rich repeat-containing protein [Pseudolabrys sp.]
MFFRIVPVVAVLLVVCGSPLLAQDRDQPASSSEGGLFKGTPQEQAACRPDAVKFCSDSIPDSFRVLACLQEHEKKLGKACKKVLESHGQL